MKKLLSIFVMLILFSVGANAQGISGGAKLGLNLANETLSGGSYTTSPNFLPSIHAGGYLTLMVTEHLGLQPEVLYSAQGYKSGSYTFKSNFITIPILVRFNVNDFLSFHAGPQVGLLASAKLDNGSTKTDVKSLYKSTDVGIAFGATVDLPMKLNFTFRLIKGLSDIDNTASTTKIRTFNLQLSVGYRLFGKN